MIRRHLPHLLAALVLSGMLVTSLLFCRRDSRTTDQVFTDIDISLQASNKGLGRLNSIKLNIIKSEAKINRSERNQRYAAYAIQLGLLTNGFYLFIDSIKQQLVVEPPSKGIFQIFYPVTGQVLTREVSGGYALADHIALKSKSLYDFIDTLSEGDPLIKSGIPFPFEYFGNGRFKINGLHNNFLQLPLAGILAVLSDLQNQAMASAGIGLNHCLLKVSDMGWGCIDFFSPSVAPKTSYVIPGETYEADIFLSPYCLDIMSWEVKINGKPTPLKEGAAHYEVSTSSIGIKYFTVESLVRKYRRTETGAETDTFKVVKEFSYEVGCESPKIFLPPTASYLYAGVDNPFTVIPRCGLAPNAVNVKATNADMKRTGPGQFVIHPKRPGKVILHVHIGLGLGPSTYEFTARPLPDPAPALGDSLRGSRVTPEEIARQISLTVRYPEDFDFQADCAVVSFQLSRIRPREDAVEIRNKGGIFNQEVKQILATTRPGDRLLFHDIIVHVPGGAVPRTIGAMVFQVE